MGLILVWRCGLKINTNTEAKGFHVKVQTVLNIRSSDSTKKKNMLWFHVSIQFLLLGWYEGERLRDGERGWFLAECAQPITCQATIERNMQRMDRLQGLETNVWAGRASRSTHRGLFSAVKRPFDRPWPAFLSSVPRQMTSVTASVACLQGPVWQLNFLHRDKDEAIVQLRVH